ncbi:NUDIX hydrolase N-terminal domain-containing protein [Pectinatus haikarae]|uniref:NUDIX hydrolase N-terminal domain-containing protein n=1 Tax=Pectinatus haikarae TaxID=349096 RepID=UPI0018C464D2|nr:NUDIX hydrolase N-terminal domain-containing protein [Pectinatus haikarae]
MRFKNVVFDMDGTLIDTHDILVLSLREALKEIIPLRVFTDSELSAVIGIPGEDGLRKLGVKNPELALEKWNLHMKDYHHAIKIFDGIKTLLKSLKEKNIKLGIVTSKLKRECKSDFFHLGIAQYFDVIISADDTAKHKPFAEPLLKYMEIAGAERQDVLYIGDTIYDIECAAAAKAASGLAVWGCRSVEHIKADYYFRSPAEIIYYLEQKSDPLLEMPWLKWAMELRFIAQAGLYYSKNKFDIERFERISSIAVEMLALKTGIPTDQINSLFCNEKGFQTPKIDTRAVIFNASNEILLVQETDEQGTWSLPGGWVDIDKSIAENTVKEALEESGLTVFPRRIISVQERNRHNRPVYAYSVCKIFIECDIIDGSFKENSETSRSAYFSFDCLPPLSEKRNTAEQLALCFKAHNDIHWNVIFD